MNIFSRDRKTLIAEWWWTVDRELLGALFALMGIGILMSFAASPAVAERLKLGEWHFIIRHMLLLIPTIGVMLGVSLMTPRQARFLALGVLGVSMVLLAATLVVGTEIKGSQRWLSFAGQSLQPSEFVKPAFAVIAGWLMAERMRRTDVPGHAITLGLLGMIVGMLILQPDVGQTVLILLTWAALLFIAGISWWVIAVLGGLGIAGITSAYLLFPHVSRRIDTFLGGDSGDNYQVEKALQSLVEGGWFGRGPGEAVTKRFLPDAHADFVFSAAAGEFGILFCMALVGLIGFVVWRGLSRAQLLNDLFARLAASALVIQFGLQSAINLMVNINLIPPKGMTLPFVSYGGTSMIAVAFGMGILLALTRRKPQEAIASGLPLEREALRHEAA
ncbi:FtsW/RodA/SpoVE family cell cycle protein [Cucumibacter marinus]|uniref:FtsW/RodA/SpoVE family cell cycle protein n=1 Tax=Cucumibacter marinus TaxID=1121252 RepID=UPI000416CB25